MSEDVNIQFLLGQITAKLEDIKKSVDAWQAHSAHLEERIARLEAWRYGVLGGATVIAVMVEYGFKLLKG